MRALRQERGFSLIEVCFATAILGIIAVGFLTGLADSTHSTGLSDERTMAESLARSEMEYVRDSIYVLANWEYELPLGYPSWDTGHTVPSGYEGYAVHVAAAPLHVIDDGIQSITVTVKRDEQAIFTLEGYKVTRNAL